MIEERTQQSNYKVMLGMPGPTMSTGTGWGLAWATLGRHSIRPAEAMGTWDNFSILWGSALNVHEFGHADLAPGELTHFAMLHADVAPMPGWLDMLIDEMDAGGYSMVSTAIPLKGPEGIVSCGVGRRSHPWGPWRRLTLKEIYAHLPETFTLEDVLQKIDGRWPDDPVLLHNNGCWVADLRCPEFHVTAADGNAAVYFQFPKRMRRNQDGYWTIDGESEDWFFSRRLHETGVKTAITRKVQLTHVDGNVQWTNAEPWGQQEHDEVWRKNWDREANL